MSYSRRGGPSHNELVAGLRIGHALTLGRDLVDGFSLSSADSSIAVSEIRYPFGQMSVKGVINANTGDIVVLPMVQKYDTSRCVSFVATTMASKRYLDDPVRYGFRVIGYSEGGSADYMDIDGMLVRRTYSPIVRSEADKRYPRDEYFNKYVGRYLRYGL